MAKNKAVEETRTSIDNINDNLTNWGAKIQRNRKIVSTILVVVAAIVAIILVYVFFIRKPAVHKADVAVGKGDIHNIVDMSAEKDSLAIIDYTNAASMGYDGGNRAKLMLSMKLYEQGDYEQALKYIEDYDADDEIIGSLAYAHKGDCYVNLDQFDKALEAFEKAIKQADGNTELTPYFMQKIANIYHAQGKYSDEANTLKDLAAKYPKYVRDNDPSLRGALERANHSK